LTSAKLPLVRILGRVSGIPIVCGGTPRVKTLAFVRNLMSDKSSELGGGWWAKNLDEIDREIARLATICNVRILDPGVIERV